jgi:hypothetical protein
MIVPQTFDLGFEFISDDVVIEAGLPELIQAT